jgi:hypothetical protein
MIHKINIPCYETMLPLLLIGERDSEKIVDSQGTYCYVKTGKYMIDLTSQHNKPYRSGLLPVTLDKPIGVFKSEKRKAYGWLIVTSGGLVSSLMDGYIIY